MQKNVKKGVFVLLVIIILISIYSIYNETDFFKAERILSSPPDYNQSCLLDVNNDGLLNFADVNAFYPHVGLSGCGFYGDAETDWCNFSDFDRDGVVNNSDAGILSNVLAVYSGACDCSIGPELCDGYDNDCDGEIDEGCDCINLQQQGPCYVQTGMCSGSVRICVQGVSLCNVSECMICLDDDSDGFGLAESDLGLCAGSTSEEDCDDNDFAVNPEAIEICNGIDDNCDGEIDEGCESTCEENPPKELFFWMSLYDGALNISKGTDTVYRDSRGLPNLQTIKNFGFNRLLVWTYPGVFKDEATAENYYGPIKESGLDVIPGMSLSSIFFNVPGWYEDGAEPHSQNPAGLLNETFWEVYEDTLTRMAKVSSSNTVWLDTETVFWTVQSDPFWTPENLSLVRLHLETASQHLKDKDIKVLTYHPAIHNLYPWLKITNITLGLYGNSDSTPAYGFVEHLVPNPYFKEEYRGNYWSDIVEAYNSNGITDSGLSAGGPQHRLSRGFISSSVLSCECLPTVPNGDVCQVDENGTEISACWSPAEFREYWLNHTELKSGWFYTGGTTLNQDGALFSQLPPLPSQSVYEEICNGIDDDCDGEIDEGSVCESTCEANPPSEIFMSFYAYENGEDNIQDLADSGFVTHVVIDNLDFDSQPTYENSRRPSTVQIIQKIRDAGLIPVWGRWLWLRLGNLSSGEGAQFKDEFTDGSVVYDPDYYEWYLKKLKAEADGLGIELTFTDAEPYLYASEQIHDVIWASNETVYQKTQAAVAEALSRQGVEKSSYYYPYDLLPTYYPYLLYIPIAEVSKKKMIGGNTYFDCINRLDYSLSYESDVIGIWGTADESCYRANRTDNNCAVGCNVTSGGSLNGIAIWTPQTIFDNVRYWHDVDRGIYVYADKWLEFAEALKNYCSENRALCNQYSYKNLYKETCNGIDDNCDGLVDEGSVCESECVANPPAKIFAWHLGYGQSDMGLLKDMADSGLVTHVIISNLDYNEQPMPNFASKVQAVRDVGLIPIWERDLWFQDGNFSQQDFAQQFKANYTDGSIVYNADYYEWFLKRLRAEADELGIPLVAFDGENYGQAKYSKVGDIIWNADNATRQKTREAIIEALNRQGVEKSSYYFPAEHTSQYYPNLLYEEFNRMGKVLITELLYFDCKFRLEPFRDGAYSDMDVGGIWLTADQGCYRVNRTTSDCLLGDSAGESVCGTTDFDDDGDGTAIWTTQTIFDNVDYWFNINRGIFVYTGEQVVVADELNDYCSENRALCDQYSYQPLYQEACNGIDDNCDGRIDEGVDCSPNDDDDNNNEGGTSGGNTPSGGGIPNLLVGNECEELWNCGDWSACINGTRTRECYDIHYCGTEGLRPEIEVGCEVESDDSGMIGGTRYDVIFAGTVSLAALVIFMVCLAIWLIVLSRKQLI